MKFGRKSLIVKNARSRTRTGTVLQPRDFKSLVSTYSTIRAKRITRSYPFLFYLSSSSEPFFKKRLFTLYPYEVPQVQNPITTPVHGRPPPETREEVQIDAALDRVDLVILALASLDLLVGFVLDKKLL